jgi:hypothetical protein
MFFILTKLKPTSASLIIFWLCTVPLLAQIEQLARYELPAEDFGREPYKVVSAKHQGVLLCRNTETREGGQLAVIRLDTTLQERWSGIIPIERNLRLLYTDVRQQILFLLFKDRSSVSGDFLIVSVQISNGNYGSYIVKNLIPFTPTEFKLTNEAALIGGYFNYRPLIVYYNFSNRQSKVLPGFFNEPGDLNQVRSYPDGSIDVITSARNFEKKKCLWIRNYNHEGNLVKTIILTPEDKKTLLFGTILTSSQNEQIVVGVYGRHSDYSRGIFVANINPMGEYEIQYYNYSELEHFFNYMKASRQKRIKERIERKKVKGRKAKFNYRFLVHELIPYKNQFIMVGEAFYPHYTYNGYNNRFIGSFAFSPRYSTPMIRDNNMVFDGYQYTHAVVIGFNEKGKIIWDNSFQINDVKSMQLEEYVKIQPGEDQIAIHYLFENILRTKIIKDFQVFEGKTSGNAVTKSKRNRNKPDNIAKSVLENWYGNYFYTYGTQEVNVSRVNSKGGVTQDLQKVFFINKITYK